jgi:hypothetical protein
MGSLSRYRLTEEAAYQKELEPYEAGVETTEIRLRRTREERTRRAQPELAQLPRPRGAPICRRSISATLMTLSCAAANSLANS